MAGKDNWDQPNDPPKVFYFYEKMPSCLSR